MVYLTFQEIILFIISVSSLTLILYNSIRNRKARYKRCTFIDVD